MAAAWGLNFANCLPLLVFVQEGLRDEAKLEQGKAWLGVAALHLWLCNGEQRREDRLLPIIELPALLQVVILLYKCDMQYAFNSQDRY